jgi:hypothetical protein
MLDMLLMPAVDTYICNIIPRKQYLGNRLSKKAKKSVPHAHELTLAYSGQSLLASQLTHLG